MDELLRRAPQTVLALIAIGFAYLLIIGFNPPRSVCDEQLDVFRLSQKAFLNVPSEKVSRSVAEELFELCKSDNGPGGCFDLFLNVRNMVDGLERIPKNCASTVAADAVVKKWLLKTTTLMTQIAWGESSGTVYISKKHSWLDAADFRLFCRLKAMGTRLYGEDGFGEFRESLISSLPGADQLSREQKWSRSIFSSSCD